MDGETDSTIPALGSWWVAGNEGHIVHGVLTRESEHYRLVTDGFLRGDRNDPESTGGRFTIHGVSMGRAFTLLDAVAIGWRQGSRRYMIDPPDDLPLTTQQNWAAASVVTGGHLQPSEGLRECRAMNSGAGYIWHRRVLNTKEFDDDGPMEECVVARFEDYEVRLVRWPSISLGRLAIAAESRLKFVILAPAGMTLTELERKILMPLDLLVANLEYRATHMWGIQLFRTTWCEDNPKIFPAEMNLDPDVVRSPVDFVIPLLSADDGQLFEQVATQWLLHARDLASVMGIIAPHPHVRGYVQTEAFQAVGAAEELDRIIHPDDAGMTIQGKAETAMREFLTSRGVALGLNARQRNRLVRAVRNGSQPSLEQRLTRLARDLGALGEWLLHDQVDEWALVAASVRNEIAHGLHRYRWAYDDWDLLILIQETAAAIARLRTLLLCGMPLPLLNERCRTDWHYLGIHGRDAQWTSHAKRLTL